MEAGSEHQASEHFHSTEGEMHTLQQHPMENKIISRKVSGDGP